MDLKDYIEEKKELYELVIQYIDDESDDKNVVFENLIQLIEEINFDVNHSEFRLLLHLIVQISNNHYRGTNFFAKIEAILSKLKIKQTFSNSEIFKIFKSNKRILLYLIQSKILEIDQIIADQIIDLDYSKFLYTEVKAFIKDDKKKEEIENHSFEADRQMAENDSIIGKLIRADSVEEFIAYVNKSNINLNLRIPPSIYETNSYLLKLEKLPYLIEYAAFFGAIQIFEFMLKSEVELTSSIWNFALHSNNPDLIHLLEEYTLEPESSNYQICLSHAILFHNNSFARYIVENKLDEQVNLDTFCNLDEIVIDGIFSSYNLHFFPSDFNNRTIFYCLIENYYTDILIAIVSSRILKSDSIVIFKLQSYFCNSKTKNFNHIQNKKIIFYCVSKPNL